ncbi:hypothetical protein E3N88_00536 [Mikania micrantha]|uniref:NB-ARC domain-containing protein n=1 Tax=Mikania micrantha TaxID=192012 RepID=A0A5N6Q126_9ASTR|nr:hypothetical protein E3N88_00536 [Mikania micrantha]
MVTLPGTLPVGPTIQSGTEPVTELEINLERPGINEIDAEVDATIQVCESVGIDLGDDRPCRWLVLVLQTAKRCGGVDELLQFLSTSRLQDSNDGSRPTLLWLLGAKVWVLGRKFWQRMRLEFECGCKGLRCGENVDIYKLFGTWKPSRTVKVAPQKMDFISPIVTSIVGSLMVPVKKNLGFFFYSTKHVANMRKKLSKLNEAKHDMEDKKKDALINDQLIPDSLHHWLDEVEKIIGKTENIPTHGNGCLNLKIRYEAGRSSFKILEEIDKIIVEKNNIVINKQRPLGMVRTSTGPSTSQSDYDVIPNIFRSRLLKFNNVLKSLEQDNNTQMMALWGMGGVGKTTMMKDIKKVVEKRKMFAYVLKVDIGTKYDPITTQKHIANHMGVTLNEQTKEDRVERLEKIFEQMSKMGKKILFILDDVWDVIDLKDIGLEIPFPKGFKLLVTSRKRHVCISMGIETVFEVAPLEQEEAKQFFFDSVNISNEDEELYIIGEDIVNKCRGLPIAIKTIALTLRRREKVAWEAALDDMQ